MRLERVSVWVRVIERVSVSVGTQVVIKLDGPALLCKTDEVGELCLSANFTGTGYWGLPGRSTASFKVYFLSPVLLLDAFFAATLSFG